MLILIYSKQPDEKPDATDETSDEQFSLVTKRRCGGDQIDRSRIDETSFGG